jgi:hypothetical protein
MLYYIRYSASYSILGVLSYVLRSAYRPTISRAYSYTPTYPTVLTIVHSDGTPSIPPQCKGVRQGVEIGRRNLSKTDILDGIHWYISECNNASKGRQDPGGKEGSRKYWIHQVRQLDIETDL